MSANSFAVTEGPTGGAHIYVPPPRPAAAPPRCRPALPPPAARHNARQSPRADANKMEDVQNVLKGR
jgi:hypothetical protein